MTKEMRVLLEQSYKGKEVIEYIESLEDKLKWIVVDVLRLITGVCIECPSRECCPEDECVLYRIEQIVENGSE